jgi:hypothetical protein
LPPLWSLERGPLATPAPIRPALVVRIDAQPGAFPASGGRHDHSLQDLCLAPDGSLLAIAVDRQPLSAWDSIDGFRSLDLPLAVRLDYSRREPKRLSLSVAGRRWAVIVGGALQLATGGEPQRVGAPLIAPLDVACDGSTIAVADPEAGALVLFEGPAAVPQVAVRLQQGSRPLAVAISGQRLVFVDGGLHQLLQLDPSGRVHWRRQLGIARRGMRLAMSRGGRIALLDPTAGSIRLYSPRGALIAPGGDPTSIDALIAHFEEAPVACAFTDELTLAVVTRSGRLLLLDLGE